MAIQRAQEDAWTQEMAKWEARDVMVGGTFVQAIPVEQGGRKDAPRKEYPKMLYRGESAMGGPRIGGYKIVQDEGQEHIARGQGWSVTQEAALEAVGAQELEFARLAANRAHNETWMSDKARAEARAVDESTMQHLPVIPTTPIRKRGRPVKVKPETELA